MLLHFRFNPATPHHHHIFNILDAILAVALLVLQLDKIGTNIRRQLTQLGLDTLG